MIMIRLPVHFIMGIPIPEKTVFPGQVVWLTERNTGSWTTTSDFHSFPTPRFAPTDRFDNMLSLVKVMAWGLSDTRPLPEPIMTMYIH